MLLVDYPTSFGGNVLQRPAQVDGIQAKMGEGVCLVFHPTSSPMARSSTSRRIIPAACATAPRPLVVLDLETRSENAFNIGGKPAQKPVSPNPALSFMSAHNQHRHASVH